MASQPMPAPAMTVVVGQQFCAPYPVNLTITREMLHISYGNYAVTDANGNLVFKVLSKELSNSDRHILVDASSNPIVSFAKIVSLHSRWKVYRGDSKDPKDLIFSVKKSSVFRLKTKWDVFLAYNINEDYPNFRIKCSWSDKACNIYAGNSSALIAKRNKKHSASGVVLEHGKFEVTVDPHVDYAFIVALMVILEEINNNGKNN